MTPPKFHPVAELFPLMRGSAFDELVADIAANGLREPIWLYDGKIIDGRNRYAGCAKAGVEPQFRTWDGKGCLAGFVVSQNLHRRHLNESQRAMIAAGLATRGHGVRGKPAKGPTREQGAQGELAKRPTDLSLFSDITTPKAAEL